jgi:hypothetical protein
VERNGGKKHHAGRALGQDQESRQSSREARILSGPRERNLPLLFLGVITLPAQLFAVLPLILNWILFGWTFALITQTDNAA